jgi:hypothetical protein
MVRIQAVRWLLLIIVIAPILGITSPSVLAQNCNKDQQRCNGRCIPSTSICILEPLPGGVDEIPSGGIGFSAFFMYLNNGMWQLIYKIGVAATVFSGVLGGFQIIVSNGDSGKIDAGKSRFIHSIIALIVLLLAGVILEFLNPSGFTNA